MRDNRVDSLEEGGAISTDLIAQFTSPEAQAWGFAVTMVGLPISIGGFWVAIWQIGKTKKAADAAALAVDEFRTRLSEFDVIGELNRAEAAASETIRYLELQSWAHAMDSYRRLRASLVRATATSVLQADDFDALRSAIPDVASTTTSLQSWQTKPPKINSTQIMTKQLEMYIDAISAASVRLQGSAK